jgi:hypothetical protein
MAGLHRRGELGVRPWGCTALIIFPARPPGARAFAAPQLVDFVEAMYLDASEVDGTMIKAGVHHLHRNPRARVCRRWG